MVAFEPPVLSEVPHSLDSLRLFNEVSTFAAVLDYKGPKGKGPKVVWANFAARDLYNRRSLEEMLGLDVSWGANSTEDERVKTEVGAKFRERIRPCFNQHLCLSSAAIRRVHISCPTTAPVR